MIDDLRHFRADNERMRRLAWTLGITAAVMLFVAGSWNLMDAEEAAGQEGVQRLGGLLRAQPGSIPGVAGSTPAPVLAAPSAPEFGSMVSAPHWLCMSSRDGQERRFAIAHQRESDHEWEIACGYGPAFPRGGI